MFRGTAIIGTYADNEPGVRGSCERKCRPQPESALKQNQIVAPAYVGFANITLRRNVVLLLATLKENQVITMNEFGFVDVAEFGFDLR